MPTVTQRKIRVVVAKPGLDGHDRGAKIDIPELKALGVAEVFTPGAPTQAIIDFIRSRVETRMRSSANAR